MVSVPVNVTHLWKNAYSIYRLANLKNGKPGGSHKKTWKSNLRPADFKQVSYIVMKSALCDVAFSQ